MQIPVFVSAPTKLNADQTQAYDWILNQLEAFNLERRALGRSDYPTELPLREVTRLCRKCSGGLILGFTQQFAETVTDKPGTDEVTTKSDVSYPTAWNNLEAGILFSLNLPILIFKEKGITGGVFDQGVTDVFVHRMPTPSALKNDNESIREVFLRWQGRVRAHYYAE